MFLVTGAKGNVGSEVVRAFVDAGEEVRGLIRRDQDQVALPAGVEGVVGDLNQPESLGRAVQGARGVFLLSGYRDMPDTLARMRRAGVEHVVLLSSSAAPGGDLSNPVARYHIESEAFVRESGLSWTFLQPNSFMTNTLQWAPQIRAGEAVRAPFAEVPIATIDPADIGAVAVAAFTGEGHAGRSYRLSGPESLRPADRVAVLARVLGHDLSFEAQPDGEARDEMRHTMPEDYVDAFFSFFRDHTIDESIVLPTVQTVTGRRPRSFEDWARRHAGAFQ